jgi:hypothetical protein
MIHYTPVQEWPPANGASVEEWNRHRERFTTVEASRSHLRKAKRAADESLRRAQDAPEPHTSDNSIFAALWEVHLAHREALFDAMRRLDEASEALRSETPRNGNDK